MYASHKRKSGYIQTVLRYASFYSHGVWDRSPERKRLGANTAVSLWKKGPKPCCLLYVDCALEARLKLSLETQGNFPSSRKSCWREVQASLQSCRLQGRVGNKSVSSNLRGLCIKFFKGGSLNILSANRYSWGSSWVLGTVGVLPQRDRGGLQGHGREPGWRTLC